MVFVGLDANDQHYSWCSPSTQPNRQGTYVYNMLQGASMHISRIEILTFWDYRGIGFYLYIFAQSTPSMVSKWKVWEHQVGLTNHNAITFQLNLGKDANQLDSKIKLKWRAVDWDEVLPKLQQFWKI